MSAPIFERITIIGLGLIGSSIARAAKQYGLAKVIVGCDSHETSLHYARAAQFIDIAQHNAAASIESSELIILAIPPSGLLPLMHQIAPALKPGMILMDVASIKEAVVTDLSPLVPEGVDFIPAHPIAGSEQSGIAAGKAELFKRKLVILTPQIPAMIPALQKITHFWTGMGARTEAMPAQVHDLIYAYVSHLPQLLAYGARGSIPITAQSGDNLALQRFLRISRSQPALWMEIFDLNQHHLLSALDRYLDALNHVQDELKAAPPEAQAAEPNETLAATVLFPRIVAACLVTTVMEAERKNGFPFARFAGSGFADFTSPASLEPEADIEQISGQHALVAALLDGYSKQLGKFRDSIAADDMASLQAAILKTGQ